MTFLLLRADASPSTGVGHLSRCVAVASAARERGWEVALCGTVTAGQWLLGDLPVVPTPIPADAMLVDHYDLGEVRTESLLVSMEDGPFGRRRADIVVDANLHPLPRPDDGSPVVLRGPAYAPLRPEILKARARRTKDSTPPKVLVVMGGGATPTAVAAAVEALAATGVPATVVAISATPIPNVATIPPTPDLPNLLASADLVVSAAGVTLLELCCIGTPAALVQIADNQAAGYTAAVSQGLASGLGTDPRDHVETLRTLLNHPETRKALAEKAMTTVDGQGAKRILTAIETTLHESPTRPPGGPPISSLPRDPDSPTPKKPTTNQVHPPNPNESPTHAPGGPPVSNLPAGPDNPDPQAPTSDTIGANRNESPFDAPGGPPVSTLPAGTDNSDMRAATDDTTRADRSEGPLGVLGERSVSTLPPGADDLDQRASAGGKIEADPGEIPVDAPDRPPVSTLPAGNDNADPQVSMGDTIGANRKESSIDAPGEPQVSALPPSTDDSGSQASTGDTIGADPSESPFGAPEGPPVSTLPAGTDSSSDPLVVRAATAGDSGLLLAWRNDSETRAWSRTTDPVSAADHDAWLGRVLDDPDRRLLIVERGGRPVGTVRFDRDGGHWEVSITVAPEARGRRLAVPVLLAAEETISPAEVRACVHRDNRASRALFDRAGYRYERTDGPWQWFAKGV